MGRSLPDWRDERSYAPLLLADRSLICWEWLRRDPSYRTAYLARGRPPQDWGLVDFEDPDRRVPDARPIWSASHYPAVLQSSVEPGSAQADTLDLDRVFACRVDDGSTLHCCQSDGYRTIRLDIAKACRDLTCVRLAYRLSGFASLDRPLATLLRLRRFVRTGAIEPEAIAAHRRARLVLLLRTFDALQARATQRDIAGELLSATVGMAGWRIEQPHVRARAQRLVRSALAMAGGQYRSLLR